jgi:hypothetical protein
VLFLSSWESVGLITPFCSMPPINLRGIGSPPWDWFRNWLREGAHSWNHQMYHSACPSKKQKEWTWWWEGIGGVLCRRPMRVSSEDVKTCTESLFHSANVYWLLVAKCHAPGTRELEIKVIAPASPELTTTPQTVWGLFFSSKGILRKQHSLEPSLLTRLDFINQSASNWGYI